MTRMTRRRDASDGILTCVGDLYDVFMALLAVKLAMGRLQEVLLIDVKRLNDTFFESYKSRILMTS